MQYVMVVCFFFLDLDECEDPSVCPDKANCFNMAGSFMCYCLPGYKMIAKTCISKYFAQTQDIYVIGQHSKDNAIMFTSLNW